MAIPMLDLRAQYAALKGEIRTALDRVLESQKFVLGPEGEAFEREMAGYNARRFAVGVASGTDALVLALRAIGVEPGDEVIVPAFTFIATAGAVVALGARPVFADSEPATLNLDPVSVEARLTPRTKAIVAVHLYGLGADLAALNELAQARGVALVEDNAQSLGATYLGKKLGTFGVAATTSFYPSKNLGAYGDAGMVLTDSGEMAERLRRLRNHGQTGSYVSSEAGWNSRLDEMQAAILRIKLRRLDGWIAARQALAARYDEHLRGIEGLELPATPADREHSYYLYTVRIATSNSRGGAAGSRRDRVAARLREQGIGCAIYYPVPLHLQPVYRALGGKPGDLPVAERAAEEVLSLPIYPEMSVKQVDRVADAVKEALGR